MKDNLGKHLRLVQIPQLMKISDMPSFCLFMDDYKRYNTVLNIMVKVDLIDFNYTARIILPFETFTSVSSDYKQAIDLASKETLDAIKNDKYIKGYMHNVNKSLNTCLKLEKLYSFHVSKAFRNLAYSSIIDYASEQKTDTSKERRSFRDSVLKNASLYLKHAKEVTTSKYMPVSEVLEVSLSEQVDAEDLTFKLFNHFAEMVFKAIENDAKIIEPSITVTYGDGRVETVK